MQKTILNADRGPLSPLFSLEPYPTGSLQLKGALGEPRLLEGRGYPRKNIYWIRHAQSEFNAEYEKSNYTIKPYLIDSCLTDKGINQALQLGTRLQDEIFDLIIVSPLKRTQQISNMLISKV